jgi:thioredoxin reductase (NADPH)
MTDTTPTTDYDVIIVGGAAAGLTAALYSSRRTLKTLIITKALGGQLAMTPSIENYPSVKSSGGMELMQKFLEHAQEYGAEIVYETVGAVRKEDGIFYVKTNSGERTARAVILAFGMTPKNLDVPGEEDLQGKGVTYCATCDAPLFKSKPTAVVGGTYEALDAALLLAKLDSDVTLIHKKDGYPRHKALFEEVQANPKVTTMMESEVVRIEGEAVVESVVLRPAQDDGAGEEITVPVKGVFIENGHKIDASWVGDMVELNKGGSIIVDEEQRTKTDGLFAAGDVTPLRDKQVIVSAGTGAVAALSAYHYLQKQAGKPVLRVDWQHSDD